MVYFMKKHSEKSQKTRSAVVGAAAALFHSKGYGDTSMDDIIRACGVAKGNVYYHFKNKEAVALAALERHKSDYFTTTFPADAATGESPLEWLLKYIDGMAERMSADGCRKGCFFGNLALEMSPSSEPIRKSLEGYFTEVERRIAKLLSRAKRKGELPKQLDASRTAAMMLGLMEGALLLGKARRDPEGMRNAARFIKDYLRGGHGAG